MDTQIKVRKDHSSTRPFFTIGLTTYQRPTLLVKAIESVLQQTFSDYELIIVDDASPDHTEQVVRPFHAPNIRYLRQPNNQGIGAARNQVIALAQGEFIIFLDDDDLFTPDFLENVHRGLQEVPATVGFALAGRRTFRSSAQGDILIDDTQYGLTSTTVKSGSFYMQMPVGGGSGLVVRAAAARTIGGFSTDRACLEDTEFMLHLASHWDYAIIPQATYLVYALQHKQLTQNRSWIGQGLERLADGRVEKLQHYPKTRALFYRRGARMFYASRDRKSGRRCAWKALQLVPFSYKTWGLFVLLELNQLLPESVRRRLLSHPRHGYQPT